MQQGVRGRRDWGRRYLALLAGGLTNHQHQSQTSSVSCCSPTKEGNETRTLEHSSTLPPCLG